MWSIQNLGKYAKEELLKKEENFDILKDSKKEEEKDK